MFLFVFFQAEDGIRYLTVTGVQTCALPICDNPVSDDRENEQERGNHCRNLADRREMQRPFAVAAFLRDARLADCKYVTVALRAAKRLWMSFRRAQQFV